MKRILPLLMLLLLLFSCTKEVRIDIPGFDQAIVVDGMIETGLPPLVLLSKSQNIYAPTNLQAYLNGFISGAKVTVSDGVTTIQLDEICSDNLPPGTEPIAAAIFGIPESELGNFHLCAYTTFNPSFIGQIGKTYTLTIEYEGKTYSSSTKIEQTPNLVNTFWKPDGNLTDYGYSWLTLADHPNQFDGYRWEVKYLNDPFYSKPFSPFFDDQFFDGLTFEFAYENPMSFDDSTVASAYKGYFKKGDTIVIKFSKVDKDVYEFMEKKYTQLFSAGNPFASPINIPSNISGGALGVWAAYSPIYDTLICLP